MAIGCGPIYEEPEQSGLAGFLKMFVLKHIGKYILGDNSQNELVKLEGGSLWSMKTKKNDKNSANRVQVYENAEIILKRSGQPFEFELVVVELPKGKSDKIFGKTSTFPLMAHKTFDFRRSYNEEGLAVFSWNSTGHFEYVCRSLISELTVEMFHLVVAQCLWEHQRRVPLSEAPDKDIQELVQVDRHDGIAVGNIRDVSSSTDANITYASEKALFYVFDAATSTFVPRHEGPVVALITKDANCSIFNLAIQDASSNSIIHRQPIDPDATLHTDRKSFSFIWCYFTPEGVTWTFSLRFADAASVMSISNAVGQTIYEILNKAMVADDERDYLLGAFHDVEMADVDTDDESESNHECSDSESEKESERGIRHASPLKGNSANQQLLVGYKHDRSFVTRGDSICVFKHTADDDIELVTDIGQIRALGTSLRIIAPTKMMLHEEDRSLLLLDPTERNKIHKMDVECGKIVEEWKVHDNEATGITAILPDTKYSQMTNQATLVGLSSNSIFRIDPRLSGNKRVDTEMKQYVVKNEFSCGATTGAGELAVGSAKGEIRLFDKIDKKAKTLLPGFGDAILAIDVTESGRYIVATCKTYLLLICTEIPGVDALGFRKPMGSAKPIPRRLQLKPEHVAYLGAPVSFTPARFSTGQSEERAIITSTGPYVVTWNLRRVKQGHLYDYQIRKYEDKVVADNFRYGQDRSIVVTLPHHVTMISKKSLSHPSPNVLCGEGFARKRGDKIDRNLPISIENLDINDN